MRSRIDSSVFVTVARDAKFQLFDVPRELTGALSCDSSRMQQVSKIVFLVSCDDLLRLLRKPPHCTELVLELS
jgi:hypothetical protein